MDEYDSSTHVNGENGTADHKSKDETLAELRRKEQGKKYEMTKIDYASSLKKTQKPEAGFREKKKSAETPNYLENLKKTESGVTTQPEYIRLARQAESEGKHIERKYTAEELINMAFKKADDADERDPAARRGITQKPAAAPGTFQGIQVTNDEKEDYKSVLKQHVTVEPKLTHRAEDEKPSWANVTPKRVVEADIRSRQKENRQEKPEWAQFGRGATKHIVELEHTKQSEKSQAPEWASLVKTNRKKLIQLEQKKAGVNIDANQPEWAGKSRDPREILRVERKANKKSIGSEDTPDYKGVLRSGSRKESITFGELQRALGEEDDSVIGWKLIDRLTLLGETDQSSERPVGPIYEELFDENSNEVIARPGDDIMSKEEFSERKLRKVSSTASQRERRRSSVTKFSNTGYTPAFELNTGLGHLSKMEEVFGNLAHALPNDVRGKVSSILIGWANEILAQYENYTVRDFSSSWEDGLAFCYIVHYFEDDKVPVHKINPSSKRVNLTIAFQVASDSGISISTTVDEFMKTKIPDAHKVFDTLYEIYSHYCGPLVEYGVLKKD